jgi:hypothetical protein
MTGKCIPVDTNEARRNEPYEQNVLFVRLGQLGVAPYQSRQKHVNSKHILCKHKLPDQEAYNQTEQEQGMRESDESYVSSLNSLPVFCSNFEALNDKLLVRRFVPLSKHPASPLRRPTY